MKTVERLADAILACAKNGRSQPNPDVEEDVRGKLISMGERQLSDLLSMIRRGESSKVFPHIIRDLYPGLTIAAERAA